MFSVLSTIRVWLVVQNRLLLGFSRQSVTLGATLAALSPLQHPFSHKRLFIRVLRHCFWFSLSLQLYISLKLLKAINYDVNLLTNGALSANPGAGRPIADQILWYVHLNPEPSPLRRGPATILRALYFCRSSRQVNMTRPEGQDLKYFRSLY